MAGQNIKLMNGADNSSVVESELKTWGLCDRAQGRQASASGATPVCVLKFRVLYEQCLPSIFS